MKKVIISMSATTDSLKAKDPKGPWPPKSDKELRRLFSPADGDEKLGVRILSNLLGVPLGDKFGAGLTSGQSVFVNSKGELDDNGKYESGDDFIYFANTMGTLALVDLSPKRKFQNTEMLDKARVQRGAREAALLYVRDPDWVRGASKYSSKLILAGTFADCALEFGRQAIAMAALKKSSSSQTPEVLAAMALFKLAASADMLCKPPGKRPVFELTHEGQTFRVEITAIRSEAELKKLGL